MATIHDTPPPTYDDVELGTSQGPLPSYQVVSSEAPQPLPTNDTKHFFNLEDDNGFHWLKVVLTSSAETPKLPPMIKQGKPLVGALELNLRKPQDIRSIDIQVLCYVIVTASIGDIRDVYRSTYNIWNASSGHPRTGASPGKHTKLDGQFHWQFSITLPDKFTPDHGLAKDWGLPPSLPLPPSVPAHDGVQFLNYSLTVKVERSGFFSIDSELVARFFYFPNVAPSPPSQLRQLSYEGSSEPPGPEADPVGWTNVTVDEIHGKTKGSNVVVNVVLSLANPLTYTIGSFIPLLLKFRCNDPYTLDLLYNIGTPVVQLVRNCKFEAGMAKPRIDVSSFYDLEFNQAGEAKWKRPEYEQLEGDERTLIGEIPLKTTLCPSFVFGKLYEKYNVELVGFKANGFASELKSWSKTEVTLVSEYAPGPRPTPSVP